METNTDSLIGIHIDSAKAILETCRVSYRITQRGSNRFILTRDHRPDRINIKLNDNDIITSIDFG